MGCAKYKQTQSTDSSLLSTCEQLEVVPPPSGGANADFGKEDVARELAAHDFLQQGLKAQTEAAQAALDAAEAELRATIDGLGVEIYGPPSLQSLPGGEPSEAKLRRRPSVEEARASLSQDEARALLEREGLAPRLLECSNVALVAGGDATLRRFGMALSGARDGREGASAAEDAPQQFPKNAFLIPQAVLQSFFPANVDFSPAARAGGRRR